MTLPISFRPHAMRALTKLSHHAMPLLAIAALVVAMGGSWAFATDASAAPTVATTTSTKAQQPNSSADDDLLRAPRPAKKAVTGKLNLNTATEEQLMLLPTVGPAKAERVVTWRKKNGGFKRTADLRRVKGFGYKTFKRLEPYLDITGDSTLAAKR